jgi:alkanesulfonate monooxygenase SsuD/methylene tetrahydromethanopterin reductase-like flavin-dependent oxidoreductase (luciferase family)
LPGVYDNFHISPAESRGRFAEALDILIGAWTSEPFSYQGDFFQVTDLDAARNYVFQVMEYIWASVPGLLQNLGTYLRVE